MNILTTAGLILEVMGLSLLAFDLFKLRDLDEKYGSYTNLVQEYVVNAGTVLFGSAVQLNILSTQLAVIFGVDQRVQAGTATQDQKDARAKAIAAITTYTQEMIPPQDLHQQQLAAKKAAEDLSNLGKSTSSKRHEIRRFAVAGTTLVLTGAALQVLASSGL